MMHHENIITNSKSNGFLIFKSFQMSNSKVAPKVSLWLSWISWTFTTWRTKLATRETIHHFLAIIMGNDRMNAPGSPSRRKFGPFRWNLQSKYIFGILALSLFIIPSLKMASMTSNQTHEYITRSNQIYQNFVSKGINRAAKSMSWRSFGGGPTSLGDLTLLPKPTEVQHCQGKFDVNEKTKITFSLPSLEREATMLASRLRQSTGFPIHATAADSVDSEISNCICLILQETTNNPSHQLDESYELEANHFTVKIKSTTRNGIFYGTQTLLQLLPHKIYSSKPIRNLKWDIPCVYIQDGPVYSWRGMMMDSARHFFSVEYTKKFLDLVSRSSSAHDVVVCARSKKPHKYVFDDFKDGHAQIESFSLASR